MAHMRLTQGRNTDKDTLRHATVTHSRFFSHSLSVRQTPQPNLAVIKRLKNRYLKGGDMFLISRTTVGTGSQMWSGPGRGFPGKTSMAYRVAGEGAHLLDRKVRIFFHRFTNWNFNSRSTFALNFVGKHCIICNAKKAEP